MHALMTRFVTLKSKEIMESPTRQFDLQGKQNCCSIKYNKFRILYILVIKYFNFYKYQRFLDL